MICDYAEPGTFLAKHVAEMKLASKLTLALTTGVVLVHMVSGIVRVQREEELFEADVARDSETIGRALSHAVAQAWRRHGERDALDIIAHASEQEPNITIRWVWIDPPKSDHAPVIALKQLLPLKTGNNVSLEAQSPQRTYYTYVPVTVEQRGLGALEIGDSLADEERYIEQSIWNAAAAAAAMIAACLLVTWIIGLAFVERPVRRLIEQARSVGRGELEHRLALAPNDEIGELATEMDAMSAKLLAARDDLERETQARIGAIEQLRHADRLTTVGTLSSGIAHELGTPINVVEGYAQLIRETPRVPATVSENASIIIRQCQRMTTTVRQLMDFARKGQPVAPGNNPVFSIPAQVAQEALDLLEPLTRTRNIQSHINDETEAEAVHIRHDHLHQVLTNLFVNATHAMPKGGEISVRISSGESLAPSSDAAHKTVALSVSDTGLGMDPATLTRAFEPFFTTKDIGQGTGLGLSVAHGIVQEYQGWITVASTEGKGTELTVHLPLHSNPSPAVREP